MYNGKLILAISGPGGSGKDTVAAILNELSKGCLEYKHSTSWSAAAGIFNYIQSCYGSDRGLKPTKYSTVQECYDDRSNHRVFWAEYIDRLNSVDKAFLYKQAIKSGNTIITGIRKSLELDECKKQGIIDLCIWLDPCVLDWRKLDPTQEYGPEACDIVIRNPRHTLPGYGIQMLTAKLQKTMAFFLNLQDSMNAVDYNQFSPPLDGEFKTNG